MKLFIDTANMDEIRTIHSWGVLDGVTTNPSLIAKEGQVFEDVVEEIASLVDGPISAEVLSLEADGMVKEGVELAAIHKNIIIKVPMTSEGLKAISMFKEKGIRTNCTLIFSPTQALLAARAGADYVSPFIGRLDDISNEGMKVVRQIVDIFRIHNIETEVISASIRHPMHVVEAALAGSDIATIPYKVFLQMVDHPLTDKGIKGFLKDFEGAKRR